MSRSPKSSRDRANCWSSAHIPIVAKRSFGRDVSGFVRRGLNKRPFVVGDRVFVPGMTLVAEALPFEVVDTLPEDETVRVTPDTEIIVLDHDPSCSECEEDSEDVPDDSCSEDYDAEADGSDPELILGVAIPVEEMVTITSTSGAVRPAISSARPAACRNRSEAPDR